MSGRSERIDIVGGAVLCQSEQLAQNHRGRRWRGEDAVFLALLAGKCLELAALLDEWNAERWNALASETAAALAETSPGSTA